MSKAIAGAALIGGVIVTEAVMASFNPALAVSPVFQKIMFSLAMQGVAMEAGAIAGALTSNRGMNITTRQTAAARQVIYGEQRVGGVEIFRSTTGSSHDQFNFVIVIAGHEVDSIVNLYLDGRQVYWKGSGAGYSVRNGVGFGGIADDNDHTGPNGVKYNFGGTGHSGIYCEARYGDQLPGDVIGALTANDPNWAATAGGSPYVGGCTYVYLKIEYNTNLFPGEPEIRFTVRGKNDILDPRTGQRGYTSNNALIAADILTDPQFGLGDNTVNPAQLIAAANVCDEQVTLAAGGTEARYACHYHYDTTMSPGDALSTVMSGMAGRLSRIGGEWYIWPSYWQGPSFQFDKGSLTDTVQWTPSRKFRDLYNRVGGTYIAPNFPYNVAGNLYDSNGWYQGQIQNNFPFAFQQTNYPQYAADTLHGFAADEFLNEDGGVQLPKELGLQTVLSVAQAQRVAKINLMRNRQQGSGAFEMMPSAFQMQPMDVMQFTFPELGWSEKTLEIIGITPPVPQQGEDGALRLVCGVTVAETDSSVYEWHTAEELTVYDVPAAPTQTSYNPAPPTNMELLSGAGTAIVQADGSVLPRIEVTWDTPFDILTKQIQIQYQEVGASAWLSASPVDVSLNLGFIGGVVAGQSYNVRIRSARANGAVSDWEEIDGYTVSITLSVVTNIALAPGSLVAEAYSDGTADIIVRPFTADVGVVSVPILPAGAFTISGLQQSVLYWVYYVDPDFLGGAITPIATTNSSDFLNKVGYFLIDDIVTPFAGSTGGGGTGSRYAPSAFADTGARSTTSPTAVFDGNVSTQAVVSARATSTGSPPSVKVANGNCVWGGFPSIVTVSALTLSVIAAASVGGDDSSAFITATIGGVRTSMVSATTPTPQTTYTLAVPANTDISTVSVQVGATAILVPNPGGSGGNGTATASMSVAEIFIS